MIVILDFGSQYTQLIARRVREQKVYCEILPYNASIDVIRGKHPAGVILSGGPSSAVETAGKDDVYEPHPAVFTLGVPVLGVCYGHQIMARMLGGKVKRAPRREFGLSKMTLKSAGDLFVGIEPKFDVWMSHGDEVAALPHGFKTVGATENAPLAAIANTTKRLYGLQFHPEVSHTEHGNDIINNFLFEICGEAPDWQMAGWVARATAEIKVTVGSSKVLLALSGGVDSSVAAVLLHEAIGEQLLAVFVDTGLLKAGETERIRRLFGKRLEDSLITVDASVEFFAALKGITDPEKKRKAIGKTFIEVFEREAKRYQGVGFLAQGTLYTDVIESGRAASGMAHVIKTHHNVGGLPEKLNFKLLEPFKNLFKDEVRLLGKELDIAKEVVGRHPFPGPGFAVRILGEVTRERAHIIAEADAIIDEEIRREGIYDDIWQIFPVLTGAKSVGVVGDQRSYEEVLAIRAVTSVDGMTADWYRMPPSIMANIATRIVNELPNISRVVYDISSKPPATIEWE
ncbi:MAG: glutamine-hydrolyzing GMP synthase [Elusimicrobiota bacterium]